MIVILSRKLFGNVSGPLTKSGTNIIVAIVEFGDRCEESIPRRVGGYQDVLRTKTQNSISSIVPDVVIEK